MTVSNKPQVQASEQSDSFQAWIDHTIEAHKKMATDENYRQQVAARATSTRAEIQAIKAELKKEYAAQANEQSESWVQEWLERSAEAHKKMATDENYRQEVAARATGRNTPAQIEALKAKHRALSSGEIQSPDNSV